MRKAVLTIIFLVMLTATAHAAFNVTVTATKIDITSGTGTWDDLVTAVNDAGVFGSAGQVFTVGGNREIELSSGVVLTSTDGDTINWNITANVSPCLDIGSGSTYNIAPNTTHDLDTNRSNQGRIFFFGTIHCNGTAGNEIIFQNMSHVYWYMYDTTPWDWDYVTFQDMILNTHYIIYTFQGGNSSCKGPSVAHTFNNVTWKGSGATAGFGSMLLYYTDMSKWTFEDCTFDGINRVLLYYGTSAKFTNCTFTDMAGEVVVGGGSSAEPTFSHYDTSKDNVTFSGKLNQYMTVFDTCTFDNVDAGVYGVSCLTGVLLLKDCTFDNQTYPIWVNGGLALLYGTTTYPVAPTANIRYSGQGTVLHTRKLDITVYQPDGTTPLENACVSIRQKDATRELWAFHTDANGEVKCCGYQESIYLVEKEETSVGNFTQWSDGTGNLVHIITVSHPDYVVSTQEVAMTEDRSLTVTMSYTHTTLHDVVLYDTVIY